MVYRSLAACVADLEQHGMVARIECELDPHLEIAAVQRRAFRKQAPALLFTRVKGCAFPMLANLFGTMDRTRFIFRHSLRRVDALLKAKADPLSVLKHPLHAVSLLPALWHSIPRNVSSGPVLSASTSVDALPQLVSWPKDGGAFITLPLVYTEHPDSPGVFHSNLGMYRIQLSGGTLHANKQVGMHYQLHRGIGVHHAAALQNGQRLPVSINIGGPPALTLAAVMPLPEGIPEVAFAGVLGGHRTPVICRDGYPGVLAEADFCLTGYIADSLQPEGPFGDHLGYYSLVHDFPVMEVTGVYHRNGAIWPFTTVGRPPQEDTVFGTFIHELTQALVPTVFHGISEVHAVDAAGVHPLLLALGSERYTPYESPRVPRELLTQALHLLGTTQTSLAKFVMIAAKEDDPLLSTHAFDAFFQHLLTRTDFSRDLHILPQMTMDTLDYSGTALHEGAKMIWAVAGEPRRELAQVLPSDIQLPEPAINACLFRPGIVVCQGPHHTGLRDMPDTWMQTLVDALSAQRSLWKGVALIVVVDDMEFTRASWENFLWVTFTRSDPARDTYGIGAFTRAKHWGCEHTLVLDARLKSGMAPALETDPDVEKRIDALAVRNGPLYGLV